MAYNIIDILDKAIIVANKKKAIYEDIGKKKNDNQGVKILSKVLIKEVDRSIEYYESLKSKIWDNEFEEIDIGVYDKISFLINEFNRRLYIGDVNNSKEFLKFSLDLERDVKSLIIDIQGRFVKNTSDIYTETYRILSDVISNKSKHIETLEKTLR